MPFNLGESLPKKWILVRVLQTFFVTVIAMLAIKNWLMVYKLSAMRRQIDSSNFVNPPLVENQQFNSSNFTNPPKVENQQASVQRIIAIEVCSGHSMISLSVNGTTIFENSNHGEERGIHIFVLRQDNGSLMSRKLFDTYMQKQDEEMTSFLKKISDGRILIFAIKDEGTLNMGQAARDHLTMLGSEKVNDLTLHDKWIMILHKGGQKILESKSKKSPQFAQPLRLKVNVSTVSNVVHCKWDKGVAGIHRENFCSRIEGYGDVCNCTNQAPLNFDSRPFEGSRIDGIPITVMASNRPQYLFRMLNSLRYARGVNPELITVYFDGYYEEAFEVVQLFGLKTFQHIPRGTKRISSRIAQHYKISLTAAFSAYPDAKYLIIIEEDLEVSVDFFSFFNQTLELLEDESVYCVSCWNDQGYKHSSKDPSLLYRIDSMPGLGWILKRDLYEKELEPNWPSPESDTHWDLWMRLPHVRKNRQCIIPDVSRTYHFATSGQNINSKLQNEYFKQRNINTDANVLLDVQSVREENYDNKTEEMIRNSVIVDHLKNPCDVDFIPSKLDKSISYVVYVELNNINKSNVFLQIFKCLRIWDIDMRTLYKGIWRLFIKEHPLILVGTPYSPFSKYKPKDLKPIDYSSFKA